MTDGISVWSGKHVKQKAATYLYVAKNGDDVSIKLIKGDLEYDIRKDRRGDYELRATDLKNTVAEECLAESDHRIDSGASQTIGTNSITTLAVAPLEITVNLAYTKAALAHFPSTTALKNDFVIGLGLANSTLKNSNLNVRVKLGRIVFVKDYTENSTLSLVRQDVEGGLVPGLPVPTGKNKTVLVVGVFGKWDGTAILGGGCAMNCFNSDSAVGSRRSDPGGKSMRVMHIRPGQVNPVTGDLALLDQVRGEDDGWIWFDLEHADAQEESHLLSERFGIHPLAIQDAQRERHPPKVEAFQNYVFPASGTTLCREKLTPAGVRRMSCTGSRAA